MTHLTHLTHLVARMLKLAAFDSPASTVADLSAIGGGKPPVSGGAPAAVPAKPALKPGPAASRLISSAFAKPTAAPTPVPAAPAKPGLQQSPSGGPNPFGAVGTGAAASTLPVGGGSRQQPSWAMNDFDTKSKPEGLGSPANYARFGGNLGTFNAANDLAGKQLGRGLSATTYSSDGGSQFFGRGGIPTGATSIGSNGTRNLNSIYGHGSTGGAAGMAEASNSSTPRVPINQTVGANGPQRPTVFENGKPWNPSASPALPAASTPAGAQFASNMQQQSPSAFTPLPASQRTTVPATPGSRSGMDWRPSKPAEPNPAGLSMPGAGVAAAPMPAAKPMGGSGMAFNPSKPPEPNPAGLKPAPAVAATAPGGATSFNNPQTRSAIKV